MILKSKLKKALGNQSFNIKQQCGICSCETVMSANYYKEEAVCSECKTKHKIDEKSLEPVVKQLKQLGIF